jgi:hypothetical protein
MAVKTVNFDPIFNVDTLGRGVTNADITQYFELFPEFVKYNVNNSRYTPERVSLDDLPCNYNLSFYSKEEMLEFIRKTRFRNGLNWVYSYTRSLKKVNDFHGHYHIAIKNDMENCEREIKYSFIRKWYYGQWA